MNPVQHCQYLFACFPDIAGPHRYQDIAWLKKLVNATGQFVSFRYVDRVAVPECGSAPGDQFTGYALDGTFARRVDIGDNYQIGVVERLAELLVEVPRPGIGMGLEDRHDTPARSLPHRIEHCPHLGGM